MHGLSPGPRHHQWAPSSPRYVALDVDGTLVGPDGDVSDEVVAAIAAAQEAGVHAGLATGRPYGGVAHVIERTGLRGPHVTFNGAAVVRDGVAAASWPIDGDVVSSLVEECVARGVHLEVYTLDGYLVTDEDPRRAMHAELLQMTWDGVVRPGDALPEIIKLAACVFPGEGDGQDVVQLMLDHGLTSEAGTSPATPGVTYVNATSPDADKGRALTATAELLGIDVAATVAVGDAANDESMLRLAGTAIAMGQATDELRALAHLLAPAVTEHGAASALRGALVSFDGVPRPRSAA